MSLDKENPKPRGKKAETKKRRWLKWLVICAAAALVLLAIVLATAQTWIPWIVAREARKRFDLETRVGRLSFFSPGTIEIEEFSIRPLASDSPAAGWKTLTVSYASLGALLNGHTQSVAVSEPFVNLDSARKIAIAPSGAGGEPAPPLQELLAFLPKRLTVSDALLEAFGERLSAPSLTLETRDGPSGATELRFSAAIVGLSGLSAVSRIASPSDMRVSMEAQASVSGGAFELSRAAAMLDGEEVFAVKARADNWMAPETYRVEAALREVSIEEVFGAVLPNYALPGGGTLQGGTLTWTGRGDLAADLAAYDLAASINLRGAWFVRGEASCEQLEHDFSIQSVLGRDFLPRELQAGADGTLGRLFVSGHTVSGLRSELSVRSDIDPFSLGRISFEFEQTLSNSGDSSSPVALELATKGQADFTPAQNLVEARIEEGRLDARLTDGTQTQIGLGASLRCRLDDPAAPGNAAEARISALDGEIKFNGAVSDSGWPYGEFEAAGLSLEKAGALLRALGFAAQPLAGGELGFSLKSKAQSSEEATFELLLSAGGASFEEPAKDIAVQATMEAELKGAVKADWANGTFEATTSGRLKIQDLSAELEAQGIYMDDMNIELPFDSLNAAYAADGKISASLGLGRGAMEFAYLEAAGISLEDVAAATHGGTVECETASGVSTPVTARFSGLGCSIAGLLDLAVGGSIDMRDSSFRPNLTLAAAALNIEEILAMLDLPFDAAVQGAAHVDAAISSTETGGYFAEARISAEDLDFEYGKVAKGEGLSLSGICGARIGPSGENLALEIENFTAVCGSVLAGGAEAADIAIRLDADESSATWTLESLSILGGSILGSGRVSVESGNSIGWEADASLRIAGIDLEQATKTFEPPGTQMEGKIGGTINARIRNGEMVSLDFNMEAEKGTFAMNRERVIQLLLLGEDDMPGLTRANIEKGFDQRFKRAEMIPFSKLKGSGSFVPLDPENPGRSDEFHAMITIANEMIDYTLEPTLDREVVVEYLAEQQKMALGLR
jgi:hypothetical protein